MINHKAVFDAIKTQIEATGDGAAVLYSTWASERNEELDAMISRQDIYNFWMMEPTSTAATSAAMGRAEAAVTWTLMHGYQLDATAPAKSRADFDSHLENLRHRIITNPTLGGVVDDITRAPRQPYGLQVLLAYQGAIFRRECHIADCALTVRVIETI